MATPVFLPGESHWQRSLAGYSPWGCKESDTTEWLWRFLLRSKCLLISWLESPSAVILEPRKIKSVTVSIVSPSICHEVTRPDAMFLFFWMLSFKPGFSLSLSLSLRGSSVPLHFLSIEWYLMLFIFLLAVLIPACASSSSAFRMMYSAYKLNRQGDNILPWHTPFPTLNQSIVPCPVVTVASWPAYRFSGDK